jgi:hypothetical protein
LFSRFDSTNPAIWLPDIIGEAKMLATYFKNLTTKIATDWSKEGRYGNRSSSRDKESDKRKAIHYCRKLRKGIVTTRLNMNLLEKKMVEKFTAKYDNVADIDLDQHSEVSSPMRAKKRVNQGVLENIKNVTEGNSKQEDYYAKNRRSSSSSSTNISPPIPVGAGMETLPLVLGAEESYDLSDLSTEAESCLDKSEETGFSVIDDITDECNEFFNAASAMMDRTPTKSSSLQDSRLKPSPSLVPVKPKSNIYQNVYSSDSECSITAAPNLNMSKDEVNDENHNNGIVKPKSSNSIKSGRSTDFPEKSATAHARTPARPTVEKYGASKFLKVTPSSGLSSSDEEAVIDSYLETVASANLYSEFVEFDGSSTSDLNEKARQKLLLDSSDSDIEYSFDSDFSLTEMVTDKESVQKNNKTSQKPDKGDPKLKLRCEVVLNRITNQVSILNINNNKIIVCDLNLLLKYLSITCFLFLTEFCLKEQSFIYETPEDFGKEESYRIR